MIKRSFLSILLVVFLFSTVFLVSPVFAVNEVCGMDGVTYSSVEEAELAETDISYEFSCTNVVNEDGLYESMSDINFAGMLIEVGSTDIPTTLIVRDNNGTGDYTINVNEDTVLGDKKDGYTELSNWIPGDQIRVIGKKNENIETVDATVLVNLSIKVKEHTGANGWVTAINKDTKTIAYQWKNIEHIFNYTDDTRFVVGGINPASVEDLNINDRIRGRLEMDNAKIVIVLRRGANLFMKIRTFRPNATLVRLDSIIVPTTIQVKIEATEGLKEGDVNNLIGAEGALITVNITEDTKLVRKYFGKNSLSEYSIGDKLKIIGRVNNDGTIDAKIIKNNSIWKISTKGHVGIVTEINTDDSYIMVNWTPIRTLTNKKLREKLQEKKNEMIIQNVIEVRTLKAKLKKRISQFKEGFKKEIGQFKREIKNKKIKIERIKNKNVVLGDLVKRMPSKQIKVMVAENTKIVVGTNDNATIIDIVKGDKVRIRGLWETTDKVLIAETVVVVNSLPEIENDLITELDEINEVVSAIVTNDVDNSIVGEITSNTEEEIKDN